MSGRMSPSGAGDDRGVTLVEVVVVLTIMSVIMAMVTAGIVQLSATYRRNTALVEAQTQVGRAFQHLDRELRYAVDLGTVTLAAVPSAYPSLVYLLTPDTGPACVGLSLEGDRFTQRRWAPTGSPGVPAVLASGVTAVAHTDPFVVPSSAGGGDSDAGAAAQPKTAIITLDVTAGGITDARRRQLRETFIVPNSLYGPRTGSLDDCLL
jgi:prepilin-type N-terminal cleavage/methylation domain-containing protein